MLICIQTRFKEININCPINSIKNRNVFVILIENVNKVCY